jgi:hypothetical protein
MNQFRAGHTSTLLSDGTVLVVDGGEMDIDWLLVSLPSAEIFDPSQGKFEVVGQPCTAREFHTATLLKSGKVLITGGTQFSGYPTWLNATPTSELYDPVTRGFTNTGSMQVGRTQHTATLLADGRVLIAGGSTGNGVNYVPASSTEVYDPAAGSFAAAASMATARGGHTATMLPSGKVLIAGGQDGAAALASAELYDPATNTFSPTGSMASPRNGHTATLLPNGKVLIVGGTSSGQIDPAVLLIAAPFTTAELYDPATGKFSPTGSLATGRMAHTATLLSNGEVLITGGELNWSNSSNGYTITDSAEIYNAESGSFTATDPMLGGRFWHAATSLSDGSVLITGGTDGNLTLSSAEIYKTAQTR